MYNFVFKFRFAPAGQRFGPNQGEERSFNGNRRSDLSSRPKPVVPEFPQPLTPYKEQGFASSQEQDTRKAISFIGLVW